MNIKQWNRKALSLCLVVAVIATYSMNALASPPKIAGEITVSGKSLGEVTSVKVNGNTVENGSSVFSSSTISTPGDANAVINVGKIGRVQLAPNTNLKLSFDEKSFAGNLANGKVTILSGSKNENVNTVFNIANLAQIKVAANTSVSLSVTKNVLVAELLAGEITSLNSAGKVVVKKPNGKMTTLNTGETANAQDDDDDDEGGATWWWWALIFGGAIVGILLAATTDNNRVELGGGGIVVSPR